MCIKSRKHMADNITLGMVRVFVRTAHNNLVLIGQPLEPPIRHAFLKPCDTVLPDGDEEFSDDDGEAWKDR